MRLTTMKIATKAEMAAFEDDCFSHWLNKVDAEIDYDTRRAIGSLPTWRRYFDAGYATQEAAQDLQYVRDNRSYCSTLD